MPPKKRTTVFGMLGTTLDQGRGPKRFQHWRPTVSLCQHDELPIDRFELLHAPRSAALAELVASDITQVSPETSVRRHLLDFENLWALDEVYEGLYTSTLLTASNWKRRSASASTPNPSPTPAVDSST